MRTSEAVVIGAGPAGSVAACLLARHGHRVMLVDRASFPRQKLCGGCLATAGYSLLDAHKLGSIPSIANARMVHHLVLRSAKGSMRLRVPPYRVIERAQMDQDLIDAAIAAGATFLPETSARVDPSHRVELVSRGQAAQTYSPRAIIIADGIKGASLRACPEFAWRVAPNAYVGLGAIMSTMPPSCDEDAITMLHGNPGYAGIAPLGGGGAIVAAAANPAWVRASHDGPPLIALLQALGIECDPDTPLTVTGGAPGLTRTRDRIESRGRVFLIGDATGYIEPFTGEGMTWAIDDACRVVEHVHAMIEDRYIPGDWSAAHRAAERVRTPLCRISTRLLRHADLTNAVISASASVPAINGIIASAVRSMQHRSMPKASSA